MADLTGPLLVDLLSCAAVAITPLASRVYVSPGGPVVWDDCCDGQLWTRLVSRTPFPSPPQPCGVLGWTCTVGVGILRCAATVDDQGNVPAPAVLTAEALQMCADATALETAIRCCMTPLADKLAVTGWLPLGPDGGCVGGEWLLTVQIDTCTCT